MTRWTLAALLAGVALVIAACTDDEQLPGQSDQLEDPQPTAEEEAPNEMNLGDGVERIRAEQIGSFDSRPILPTEMNPPSFHVALDQDELEAGWEMYQLDGTVPEIDWEQDAVLLMGLSESGSCPWSFTGLSASDDELYGHLVYDIDHPDDQPVDCTADDNPRTFVVRIDRDSVAPDEMTVRLVHDEFEYYPLRTDTRDMPLNSIDPTRHEYPFVVWESEPPNGGEDRERVVEWADVVAVDESSIALRIGFRDPEMVPDVKDGAEFELIEPGPEYAFTRVGMSVQDASLGFSPPDMPDIYVAPYREVAVAGRDFHQMMALPIVTLHPRADDVDQQSDVQLWVGLEPEAEELEWTVRVIEAQNAIELMIEREQGNS